MPNQAHRWLIATICCLSVVISLTGSRADPIIRSVTIEGNKTVDQRLVLNVSGLGVGRKLSPSTLPDAIRQIYGLGLFQDVVIIATDDPDNADVTIRLDEFPRLGTLTFKGNKKVKDDKLTELCGLRLGQVISPHQLNEARRRVRSHYQTEGYYLTEVAAASAVGDSVETVAVTFTIKENRKVSVQDVVFTGNEQFTDKEIRGKMSNKPKSFLKSVFGGGDFNKEEYSTDKEKIIEFYRKKGYLDFVIHQDTIVLAEDQRTVTIQMTVEEGARYYFGSTTFEGNELFSDDYLKRFLKYDEGRIFNQEKFDESIVELYGAYMEDGYLYTRVQDLTKTEDSTVTIVFEISEGVPAHVRRVNILGNTKTKDKVMRREMALFPGQTLRRSALIRSVRNIMQLNYFANVEPDYEVLDNGDVDLNITVEEKPTNQFQLGGGYSGQDKFVGTVSLGWPNFRGNGQSLNLMVDFGKRRQSYQIGFTEPWLLDTPTTIGFDIYRTSRTWDDPLVGGSSDYIEERSGLGLQLGRRLTWPDDYFRIFWNYRLENINYPDDGFSADYQTASETDPYSLVHFDWPQITSSMSFVIIRDSRDLPDFATRGSRAVYRAEFGGGLLGGDWNYVKHTFRYGYFHPLFWKFAFAPKFNVGSIQGAADINDIPHSERFYAGGVHSDGIIRGYDEGTIYARVPGASTDHGLLDYSLDELTSRGLRGRALGVLNLEITAPLVDQQIYSLLFFDAGNVWTKATRMRPFADMYASVGFGLRLMVPGMGMMGFDFGWPFRGDEKGRVKPHFQFGSTF